MKYHNRCTLLMATLLGSLLCQGQSFGAAPVVCGGDRDAYIGTYEGHVGFDYIPAPETLAAQIKTWEPFNLFIFRTMLKKGYTLRVHFYEEPAGIYWADTFVSYDTADNDTFKVTQHPNGDGFPGRSGYILYLTGEPAKVRFNVKEFGNVVIGKKDPPPANDVTPKTVKDAQRAGFSVSNLKSYILDAHDCAAGSTVPQKLFLTKPQDTLGPFKRTYSVVLTRKN